MNENRLIRPIPRNKIHLEKIFSSCLNCLIVQLYYLKY